MRERYAISRHAETGAGAKSRRLSSSLPDDFFVSTCELSEEYTSTRSFPGRRGKTVGEGATATVSVMFQKGSKSVLYAVKEFRKMGQHEDAAEYDMKVKSEFSIANSLDHPNIVKTFRLCTRDGRWNHVMEYCAHGELFSLAERRYFEEQDKQCIFKQVVHGVAYLHENGIAHRDIKLENLLLTDQGHVKITDFGVSEVFSGTHPGLRSSGGRCGQDMNEVHLSSPGICGSMPYIAPEVLAKKGMVLVSIFSFIRPFLMLIRSLRSPPVGRLVMRNRLSRPCFCRIPVARCRHREQDLQKLHPWLGEIPQEAP